MPVPLRANANLRAEARYNVVTEFLNYDLHSAASSGNQGLVEYALSRGQPVNSVVDGVLPLHAACAGGDEQVVKLLIDHGADVNAPRLPRRYSNDKSRDASVPIVGTTGSTPLHFAAANGNKNIVMTLLLRGAHADRRDKHGITPAMLAEQHGWLECARVLNNWVENKDKDLRDREGAAEDPSADKSFGYEEDTSGSTRKRIQVKRSIDTALNMFKSSSTSLTNVHSQSKLHLSASTNNLNTASPPTSPTRSRGDISPSPSEDGRFSPSPSPIDPGTRRPSLPHVLQTSQSAASSNPSSRKPATLTKAPPRPRSAGPDAERQDAEMSASATSSRSSASKKLGTKYSLMNLFKKGQTGETSGGGVPLERTMSQQTTNSIFMGPSSSRSLNDYCPLPKPGYRFGGSSGTLSSSPSQISHLLHSRASPSTSSVHQTSPSSPPHPTLPLAVDLHNAMATQQYHLNRDRSGSSGSTTRPDASAPIPIPLGPRTFDEGDSITNSPPSTSPLTRKYGRSTQPPGHSRDRSGSGASLNRNVAVFDDDVVGEQSLPGSRTSSRPGILRGHSRTSSTGQSSALRALRFDSHSSSSTNRRDRDADVNPPLRGCTSAGSLNKFHRRERRGSSRSPSRMRLSEGSTTELPSVRVPGHSAPATVTDFDINSRNPEEDVDDDQDTYIYGRPILASHLSNSQTRNRGASFASSESSVSPFVPGAGMANISNADFPFSINRPPPEDSEASGLGSHLQVPSSTNPDTRMRGDSISSMSTVDSSQNPDDLSASGTTSGSGGSITVATPIRSSEVLPHTLLPPESMEINDLQDGIAAASLNERRSRSPLRQIDLDLVQSHAQAEALVQQKKQDILSAHSDGSVQANTAAGYTPLSARLAALGESLEIERKLREQRMAETNNKDESGRYRGSESVQPSSTSVNRQNSLEQKARSKKALRRPNTSSGTSSTDSSDDFSTPKVSVERVRPTHHPSLSASAVEYSPTLDTLTSPNSRSFNEATYIRPLRARTPDPITNLSRVSSLDGYVDGQDTDTELGPSLFRVSTAPHSVSKGQRDRNLASSTKLTRMGITPNNPLVGRAPPKRFPGLRSLVQTLKGRQ